MHNLAIFIPAMILCSIGHLATDIYLPSMPAMVDYFGTSATLVQLTLSAYMFSFCLTPLIIGPISDRIGRKQPIFVGLIIAIVATLFCTFSSSIYLLIFCRFLQGIGMGMVVSVSRAILPDHFQGKDLTKYFSYMAMCMPLLLAIGPPLGGIIHEYSSWRMVFATLLVYLVFLLLLAKFGVKAKPLTIATPRPPFNLGIYLATYGEILKNKKFMLYTGLSILMFVGIIAYLTVSSFLFQEIVGLTPTQYGFICVISCGVTAISGFFNSRLINIFTPRTLLFLITPLMVLSGLLLFCFNALNIINTYTLLLPVILYFATMPALFSNAGSLAFGNVKGNFGAATALIICLQFLGGSLGSAIISYVNQYGVMILGASFLFVGMGCLALLYFAGEKTPISETEETEQTKEMGSA